MLSDPHLKVVRYFRLTNDVFPSVEIKGGIAIICRNIDEINGPITFFSEHSELIDILNKVELNATFSRAGLEI